MKQIALSIDQMKYLEELGLDTSDASMYYGCRGQLEFMMPDLNTDVCTPAYTLQDILNILPSTIQFGDAEYTFRMGKYHIFYEDVDDINPILCCVTDPSDDILIVGYKALLWCIKNNYIKINKS